MKLNINKKTILKILIVLVSVTILVVAFIKLYPLIKKLNTLNGRLQFRDEIKSMGVAGIIELFILETVKMIFVILPGGPIEILYGMCYGSVKGAIYLTAAIFIDTIIVYLLVKKFGRKILSLFFSEDKIKKIENSKLLKDKNKIEYALIILFFIPGTPKDLLLYAGALLPIDARKFISIATFVRFPTLITSTIAGSNIINGHIYLIIGMYAIIVLLIAIWVLIQKKSNKNSEIVKEIMKM